MNLSIAVFVAIGLLFSIAMMGIMFEAVWDALKAFREEEIDDIDDSC